MSLRWIVILVTLILVLAALFELSQLMANWHYVVPVTPGELAYVAIFDDGAEDWEQTETLNQSLVVSDGVLRVSVNLSQSGVYSAAEPYFDDFDVSAQTRVVEGTFDDNNNGYGIIFRQLDRQNYYVFYINNDGVYRVGRLLEGTLRYLSDWIQTDTISSVPGSVNTLRVIGYDDRFQFFINDELMELCIPDDPSAYSTYFDGECLQGSMQTVLIDDSIPYGRLGVAVELDRNQDEGLIVDFDNVVVYGPEPIRNE